jgi:hypothetical protein
MIFTAIHAVAAVCKLLQTVDPAKIAMLASFVSGKRHSGKVEKPRRKSATAKKESKFDMEDKDQEGSGLEVDVDMANAVPIPTFCISDEEGENSAALLYLPIGKAVLF